MFQALCSALERALVLIVVALCLGTTCGFRTKSAAAVADGLIGKRHPVHPQEDLQRSPISESTTLSQRRHPEWHATNALHGLQNSLLEVLPKTFKEQLSAKDTLWLLVAVIMALVVMVIALVMALRSLCLSRKSFHTLAPPLEIRAQANAGLSEGADSGRGHKPSNNASSSSTRFDALLQQASWQRREEPEESPDETDAIEVNLEESQTTIAWLKDKYGDSVRVCMLGDSNFLEPDTEELVRCMARELAETLGIRAVFVTASLLGAQQAFAESCGDGSRLVNLVPKGASSNLEIGSTVQAGQSIEECRTILNQVGDIYVTVEGGPEIARAARSACARGASVVPVVRTGSASSGKHGFPSMALRRPSFARAEDWVRLTCTSVSLEESGAAVAAIVAGYAFMFECHKEAEMTLVKSVEKLRVAKGEQKEAAERVARQVLNAILAGQQLYGQWSHDAASFFDVMDRNDRGMLSPSEIGHCIRKLGCVRSHEDIWLFVCSLKTDTACMITRDDFAEVLTALGK